MNQTDVFSKEAFYHCDEFHQEMIRLMVPDILQFIRNIFYNFRLAEESRIIYEDITKQLADLRQSNKMLYSSFMYKVGNIFVDGRAYAQRNIREWCISIHKIVDSVFQIINIVYGLEKSFFEVNKKVVNLSRDSILCDIMKKAEILIRKITKMDDYTKHILNVWGKEKLSPSYISEVDYFVDTIDGEMYVSELLNQDYEKEIKTQVIELLDYLIDKARSASYSNRKYVDLDFDPEIPNRNNVELSEVGELDSSNIVKLEYKCDKLDDGTFLVNEVKMDVMDKPNEELYLMGTYNFITPAGISLRKVAPFTSEEISVYKEKVKIGTYQLQDKTNNPSAIKFSKYKLLDN